jgi:uncharacterized membrane protein YdjX (TVP38/TMEM64 family)
MNAKRSKKIQVFLAILKFAALLIIVVGIPLFLYLNNPEFFRQFKTLEDVNAFLDQYKGHAGLVYVGLQIVQIVISIVPGQPVQLAAGYAFGLILGYLLSVLGILIGSVISFYLGRLLGKDLVYLIFGEVRLHKFISALNSKKGILIVFLIYLIPGIPKDVFAYAGGISTMRSTVFITISMVARTPAMLCSIAVGDMFRNQDYLSIIIVAAVVLVLVIVGIVMRKRFTAFVEKIYERETGGTDNGK